MSDRCSVTMKCSSTGLDCAADDRACLEQAREKGLEVVCDRAAEGGRRFVYCPAGAQARDSSVVWILLAVAVLVAVAGGVVAWNVLRRSPP